MILSICMLIVGLLLLIYNEKFCLYFLAFIIPFTRSTQSVVLSLLVVLLATKVLLKMFIYKDIKYKRTFLDFPLALLIFIWIITTITSVSIKGSIVDFIINMLGVFLCFICIQILDTKKDYINIISSVLISDFIVSIYGVYQFFIEKPINEAWIDKTINPDLQIRAYSVLGNPNILSQYLLLILPIGIMLMLYKKKISHKIVLGILNATIFLCLVLTLSRASLIGAIAAFGIIALLQYTSLLIVLIPLGIVALVVFAPRILERLISSFNTKDTSISSRITLWQDVVLMIKDFLYTGIGFGVTAFSGMYILYRHQYLAALHSHNLYLQILAETGIVGFAIFIYFIFSVIVYIMRSYFSQKDRFYKYISLGALAAFIGILVNGIAEYTWSDFRVVAMFWITVGIGTAVTFKSKYEM